MFQSVTSLPGLFLFRYVFPPAGASLKCNQSTVNCLKLNIQKTKIMASGPITSSEIDGKTVETVADFIFWAPKSLQMVTAAMKRKDTFSLEGKL